MDGILAHHWAWALNEGLNGLETWGGVRRHYTLEPDAETPKPCQDVSAWIDWFKTAKRVLAVNNHYLVVVSTIFTGYDLQSAAERLQNMNPILWETLVFGGQYDGKGARYRSYHSAQLGHAYWWLKVRGLDADRPQASGPLVVAEPEPESVRRQPRHLRWDKNQLPSVDSQEIGR